MRPRRTTCRLTFNARFFAHLNPANLGAGLDAFPVMIGGGIAVFGVMLVVCAGMLGLLWRNGRSWQVVTAVRRALPVADWWTMR